MIGAPKEWSIAIYAGASPGALASQEDGDPPGLTFRDVDDLPARFVADPFLVRHEDQWLLFFEVLNAAREKGEIALARSADARRWLYQGTVLREPFHLSYPNVFRAGDEWLMTPEALEAGGVLLYRAVEFPRKWELDCVLLEGTWADPTVFEHDGTWWMFVCPAPLQHDRLELFFAEGVRGPWHRHPCSPIVADDPRRARPAGRPRVVGGKLMRFAQDCRPDYGNAVRAFAVNTLTREAYAEDEIDAPVVAARGEGWNADGMHTVDLHPWDGRWIAAVDGYRYGRRPECELVTELDALRGEWDALLRRSRAHRVFGSHAWMRAAHASAHVVTLRVDGQLEAILPLVRTEQGLEFATFLSDYNDFLASSRVHAARAFHWMRRALPSGTRVVLRGLCEESDALAIARAAGARVTHETDCFHADFQNVSLRKAIARARRRAGEAGLEVSRLLPSGTPPSRRLARERPAPGGRRDAAWPAGEDAGVPHADIVDIFLALNRERFGDASRFTGENEAFVREALPPLLDDGSIVAFALVRGAEVLAIDLVLVDGGTLATWNGGFAAEAARFSPGRLLFAAELAEARRFDLLRGLHPYKRAWATGTHSLYRAEVTA